MSVSFDFFRNHTKLTILAKKAYIAVSRKILLSVRIELGTSYVCQSDTLLSELSWHFKSAQRKVKLNILQATLVKLTQKGEH